MDFRPVVPYALTGAGLAVHAALRSGGDALVGAPVAAPAAVVKAVAAAGFAASVVAVFVPGRLDRRRGGGQASGGTPPTDDDIREIRAEETLLKPAPWAFVIWRFIYAGELVYVLALATGCAVAAPDPATHAALARITAAYTAGNIFQSLWCAAFRPWCARGWRAYVSVALLGSTAYALGEAHAAAAAAPGLRRWLLVPMTAHAAWTAVAAVVNLNGAVARVHHADALSTPAVIAVGHVSAGVAAALGTVWAVTRRAPAIAVTFSWALAACAVRAGQPRAHTPVVDAAGHAALVRADRRQQVLCGAGSLACALVAIWTHVRR